jgi:cold shock CspA family protein
MADKGKIIIINDGSGGIIEDPRTKTQFAFTQVNHAALCLNVGDRVKYECVTTKEGKVLATNVERITAGTVTSVDGLGGGTIEERQTMKKVPFYQPFTAEAGIEVGDVVRYSLINTKDGELAVNLTEVVE